MTKYKISLIPIILLCLSMLLCSCTTKMEAKEVYSNFIEYAKESDNIFVVTQNEGSEESATIKVGYTDKIDKILVQEREKYQQSGTPTSDFYLLKEIYEPTLNFSLNFFLTNCKILKESSSEISKEEAGVIYDSFYNLKKSIASFQNTLASLNYYESRFTDGTYTDKKAVVYSQLETFKVKYAKVIQDCFDLNNKFINLYYSIYNTVDYRIETERSLEGLYVQMLCNQSIAKLSQVGFMVDGVKCNFLNTNKSSFEIENEASAIDHTYIEHLSKISNTAKTLLLKTGTNFQKFDGSETMKSKVIILQTQLESFDKQYPYFVKALDNINYRDYVASGKTLEEYADNLDNDKKSYLYIVEDFLNNNYNNLCTMVDEIIAQV